jgi:hypothetical protein
MAEAAAQRQADLADAAAVLQQMTEDVSQPDEPRSPEPVVRRIRLGEIQAALAPIQVTADGLAHFGFQPVGKDGAAKLYDARDFDHICNAVITHARKAKEKGI